MRGGLDDALEKLARRDELRRRATGDSPGTPPAVTELVEAIAGVISRNPNLNVTVGVEGAGEPTLLHFAFADGVVQVTADHPAPVQAAETAPRHADFEIDIEEPAEEPPAPAYQPADPPRATRDDQDRFGPTDFDYSEPPTAERPYVTPATPAHNGYGRDEFAMPPHGQPAYGYQDPASGHLPDETSDDRLRPTNGATQEHLQHPFAAPPPPPVPPQTTQPYASVPPPPPYTPPPAYPEHAAPASAPPYTAPASAPPYTDPFPPQPGFPEPLAQPIPLQVERPEETELAARRLAAMLRDDPTLLDNPPA
ncbi:hypothetical protein [Actinoplanes sp. GCM10030250]|uniref:hypothetical protein n=1 Tax=Actinoplanes sp. GCM10030250 TaxID=3273376 RepID=UPI00362051EC